MRAHMDAHTQHANSPTPALTPTHPHTYQLTEVEAERVRLEKERRLLQEIDPYFYDLHDMQALYQFDR